MAEQTAAHAADITARLTPVADDLRVLQELVEEFCTPEGFDLE